MEEVLTIVKGEALLHSIVAFVLLYPAFPQPLLAVILLASAVLASIVLLLLPWNLLKQGIPI